MSWFKDMTMEKDELDDAIEMLMWAPLVEAVDNCASMPIVKCPWGCSEFLNLCNSVPLDAIFLSFLNDTHNTPMMGKKEDLQFTKGVQPDFLSS